MFEIDEAFNKDCPRFKFSDLIEHPTMNVSILFVVAATVANI